LEIVLHNGLDTEVYDLRPADYTTTLLLLRRLVTICFFSAVI